VENVVMGIGLSLSLYAMVHIVPVKMHYYVKILEVSACQG